MNKNRLLSLLVGAVLLPIHTLTAQMPDAILGKWMNEDQSMVVDIYKAGNYYVGRVVWLSDNAQTDVHHPNPHLRTRKVRGTDYLWNLQYDTDTKQWQGGQVYDFGRGTTYKCWLWMEQEQPNRLYMKSYSYFSSFGTVSQWERPTATHPVYRSQAAAAFH